MVQIREAGIKLIEEMAKSVIEQLRSEYGVIAAPHLKIVVLAREVQAELAKAKKGYPDGA